MVDRGGLNYKIKVTGDFADLTRFRTDTRKAREEFRKFKDELGRPSRGGRRAIDLLRGQARVTLQLAQARREEARAARLQTRSAALEARARTNAARRGGDQRRQTADRIRNIQSETRAVNALVKSLNALRRARGRSAGAGAATTAATPAVVDGGARQASTLRQRIRDLFSLGKATKQAGATANRASFTFRRLFGILAAFTIARQIAAAFGAAVKSMITFNQTLETSTLGIGALLLAVGQVRDATGDAADGALGLSLAVGIAREQVQLLRKDSLLTAATFEELLETLQVAVAPGLTAGLDLNQVRRFTVQISQAATAIGLAGNQLAEEIRSILSGTIQARTTRIAVALGITNEDIRSAREAGILAEFLEERFSAFDTAGKEALNTFGAIFTNLRAGIQQALGAGGLVFFNTLKTLLQDINNLIVQQEPLTGKLQINPAVVGAIREIGDALAFALEQGKQIGADLGFGDLQNVTQTIGLAIRTVATVVSGLVTGLVEGLSAFVEVVEEIIEALTGVEGVELFNAENIREVARFIGQIVGFVAPIVLGFSIISGLVTAISAVIGFIIGPITIIGTIIGFIGTGSALILGLIIAVAGALVLAGDQVRRWFSDILGVELKFISLVKIIRVSLVAALTILILRAKTGFQQLLIGIQQTFNSIKNFIINSARTIIFALLKLASLVSKTASRALKDFRRESSRLTREQQAQARALQDQSDELNNQLEIQKEIIRQQSFRAIDQIIIDNEDTPTLTEFGKDIAKDIFAGISNTISDLLSDLDLDFEFGLAQQGEEAINLVEALGKVPGVVSAARQPLTTNQEIIKKITDETLKATNALEKQRQTIGLTGIALKASQLFIKDAQTQQLRLTSLAKEESKLRERQVILSANRARLDRIVGRLSEENQQRVERGVAAARTLAERTRAVALAETQVGLARLRIQAARVAQDQEAEEAASKQLSDSEALLKSEELRLKNVQAITKLITELPPTATVRIVTEAEGVVEQETEEGEVERITTQNRLNTLIVARTTLVATEAGIQEDLTSIERDRLSLIVLTNTALAARVSALAVAQANQLQQENEVARVRLQNQRRIDAAGDDPVALRQAAVINALALRQIEIRQQQEQRERNINSLIERRTLLEQRYGEIQEAVLQGITDEATGAAELERLNQAILDIELARQGLQEQDVLIGGFGSEELARLREEVQIASIEGTNSMREVGLAFISGLREAEKATPSIMASIGQVVTSAVQGFSNIAGQAFVGIFTNKDQDIGDQLANLLEQIAAQIIGTLVQIAIVKNILLPFLGEPAATSIASAGAFNKGGQVGRHKGGAVGMAEGGSVPEASHAYARPAGLHPSDTTPIWAAKKEWVIQAKSATMYGRSAMSAINQGLIDPYELRALAGSRSVSRIGRRSPGFVEGGEVTSAVETNEETTQEAGGPSIALVISNEENMDRLLKGGKNAQIRFMGDNAGAIRAQLGIS